MLNSQFMIKKNALCVTQRTRNVLQPGNVRELLVQKGERKEPLHSCLHLLLICASCLSCWNVLKYPDAKCLHYRRCLQCSRY